MKSKKTKREKQLKMVRRKKEDFYLADFTFLAVNFSKDEWFDHMLVGETQILNILSYSCLFIFGFCLNSVSLIQLVRERVRKNGRSRMNLLLIHLALADLLVST